jgi:hypothetical protein
MKAFVCVLLMTLLALTAVAADANGKWSGSFSAEGGEGGGAFAILKQNGTEITGTAGPDEGQQWQIQKGKVEGNRLSFEVKHPENGAVYKLDLTLSGDTMKGDLTGSMPDGGTMKGKIELSRVK